MQLTESLRLDSIQPDLRAKDKPGALAELAELLAKRAGVSAVPIERGLAEREAISSTGVGNGVAIPHCKLREARDVTLALGISHRGIEFAAPDGQPVRILIALLSPVSRTGVHLAALSRVAALFRQETLLEALLRANSPEAIYQLIAEAEAAYAAEIFRLRSPQQHP